MARAAGKTRQRILHAAMTLLGQHGYDATTIDDVLEATGITKGALYYYFRGKDTLCCAAIEQAAQDVREQAATIDDSTTGLEVVRRFLAGFEGRSGGRIRPLDCSVQGRLLMRMSLEAGHLTPTMQRTLRMFWRWHHDWLVERLQRARRGGEWPAPYDASVCARALRYMGFGALATIGSSSRDAAPSPTDWLLDILADSDASPGSSLGG